MNEAMMLVHKYEYEISVCADNKHILWQISASYMTRAEIFVANRKTAVGSENIINDDHVLQHSDQKSGCLAHFVERP